MSYYAASPSVFRSSVRRHCAGVLARTFLLPPSTSPRPPRPPTRPALSSPPGRCSARALGPRGPGAARQAGQVLADAQEPLEDRVGLVARLLEAPQLSMAVQALPFAPVAARPHLARAGLSVNVFGDALPGMADTPAPGSPNQTVDVCKRPKEPRPGTAPAAAFSFGRAICSRAPTHLKGL